MKNLIKVICENSPDISYTRNKKLDKGETYWGLYHIDKLGNNYGDCLTYEIYDDNKNKLGIYFAIDFLTIEEYRNKKLEDILG